METVCSVSQLRNPVRNVKVRIEERLIEFAKSKNENGGYLLGKNSNGAIHVEDAVSVGNVEEDNMQITFEKGAFKRVREIAKIKNLSVVGNFHTHPSGVLKPSLQDKYMQYLYTRYVQAIVTEYGISVWYRGKELYNYQL